MNAYHFVPISTAPAISKIVATIQAVFIVITFAPTEVPNELATSFAPIPNDKINATIKLAITKYKSSGSIVSYYLHVC